MTGLLTFVEIERESLSLNLLSQLKRKRENYAPHVMTKYVFSFDVFMFGTVNFAMLFFVNGVHLLDDILTVRHKLAHGIGNKM